MKKHNCRIRALLVDLDGVIRTWDPANDARAERINRLPAGSILSTAFAHDLLPQVITGQISDEDWRGRVQERLSELHPELDAEQAVKAWSSSSGQVNQEVLNLIRAARCRVPVVLVTNATSRLQKDLEELALLYEFDYVANSSVLGTSKPQHQIYFHALGQVHALPHEALFVDDSPENVEAAAQIGIVSHLFNTTEQLRQLLRQHALLESRHNLAELR